MTNGRSGGVYHEWGGDVSHVEGEISIEESAQVTVVRVRGHSEAVIPWDRVVRIEYK